MHWSSLKPILPVLLVIPLFFAMKKQQDKVDAMNDEKAGKDHYKLSDELLEISGIVAFEDGFLALNDGGPDKHLYYIDSLGNTLRKIYVDANNVDWEALTIGANKLFIGDVGNNYGKRSVVNIIEIALNDLVKDTLYPSDLTIHSFQAPFGQLEEKSIKHDLDCEAMVYRSGGIHLFSKNRATNEVKHVRVDLKEANSTIKEVESIQIKGQLTDACFAQNGELLLLGYKAPAYSTFLVRFSATDGDQFFSGTMKRKKLGDYGIYGQSEAICVDQFGRIVVGAEGLKRLNRKARLHYLPNQ